MGTTANDNPSLGSTNEMATGSANLVNDAQFLNATVPSGGYATFTNGQTMGGWTVTSGSVDLLGVGFFQSAPSGGRSVDLDGSAPGGIAQTFATVVGATYLVRFEMSALGTSVTKSLEVTAAGSTRISRSPLQAGIIQPTRAGKSKHFRSLQPVPVQLFSSEVFHHREPMEHSLPMWLFRM